MAYQPAVHTGSIEKGQEQDPRVILRSDPEFPGTLSPELEGVMIAANPSWPWATVEEFLKRLNPPCHTLTYFGMTGVVTGESYETVGSAGEEMRDGRKAAVVHVRPGPKLK